MEILGDKMILDDFLKEFDEFLNELSKNCKILDDSFFRKSKYINTTKENNCCDSDELIILKRKYKAELIREIKYINSVDSEDKIFAKLKHCFLDMIRDFFSSIDSYSSVTSLKNIYDFFSSVTTPSTMRMVRSVICASFSSWVTITKVCPKRSRRSKKSLCNSSLLWLSRLPEGSSARMTSGRSGRAHV